MKNNLTIITPCSRPQNLHQLRNSIDFECTWIIVYDSDALIRNFKEESWIQEYNIKGGVFGHTQRNHGLDMAKTNQWIYFLDDDNILHPDFKSLLPLPERKTKGIVFSQIQPNGSVRPVNHVRPGFIDTAQFLVHHSIIGNKRFVNKYEADGIFIEEIYNENESKFINLNLAFAYYNKLKPIH